MVELSNKAITEKEVRNSPKIMDGLKVIVPEGIDPAVAEPLAMILVNPSPSLVMHRWMKGDIPRAG